jgi:hypothetical protein
VGRGEQTDAKLRAFGSHSQVGRGVEEKMSAFTGNGRPGLPLCKQLLHRQPARRIAVALMCINVNCIMKPLRCVMFPPKHVPYMPFL